LFPHDAPWLDTYLHELLSFPNSKNDDQVDSTVFALAWVTEHPEPNLIKYYRREVEQLGNQSQVQTIRVRIPGAATHYQAITGRMILIPEDRIIELTKEELVPALQSGGEGV
jgi:hypothetical protein